MKKLVIVFFSVLLLAASCNFGKDVKVGIIKTANGGIDWQGANTIKDVEKDLLRYSISELKYNNAGDKLYAASFNGGLYSSDDAAENWKGELVGIPIYDFAFHPFDDQVIYVAAYLSDRGRVFVTRDGAKSWTEIYSDSGQGNPVRAIAVNPNNPTELLIGTGKGTVIISQDAGASWRLLQTYNDRINRIYWTTEKIYIVAQQTGLLMSQNGGLNFDLLTKNMRVGAPTGNQTEIFDFGSSVTDYRRLAINPFNRENLLLTTNRGLFSSQNGGSTWNYVTMPFRQQDASVFAVAFAPSSANVVYVSSGAVILKSTDGGVNWTSSDTKTNGLVTSILVSNNLPQLAFAGVSE